MSGVSWRGKLNFGSMFVDTAGKIDVTGTPPTFCIYLKCSKITLGQVRAPTLTCARAGCAEGLRCRVRVAAEGFFVI